MRSAQCNDYQPSSTGFDLDVCLSANGTTVTPSINVKTLGNTGSTCTIALEIWDDHNNKLNNAQSVSCAKGQASGDALDLSTLSGTTADTSPDGSLAVHAFARLTIDGQATYLPGQGNSPTITVSAGRPSGNNSSASTGPTSRSIPASMPGPAGIRDVSTVVATPIDSVFNDVKAILDDTQGISCFKLASPIPCVTSPWAFSAAVNEAARDAGIDPRLLLDMVVGERGAHWIWLPHSSAAEMARWLAAQLGKDNSLGLTNLSSDAFADAQRAAGPGSALAKHQWSDLISDPVLAIEASAWILHGLEQQLPTSWPADYKRDELLAAGYNGGGSIMLAIAAGETPDQADPKHPGKVKSYIDVIDTGWNTADWYMCHSGAFTCTG